MGVLLNDDEAWAELERAHTGILTTLRRDGMAVSLPTWFVALDRRVVRAHDGEDEEGRRTCSAIRARPSWSSAATGGKSCAR